MCHKILIRESLFHGKEGKLGSNHAVKFSKGALHQIKFGKERGPSREFRQKCESHERSPCAPKFAEKTKEETLHQERCARGAAWDLAKYIYKHKNWEKGTFYSPVEARVMPAPASKSPEEREFVVDSEASMHMLSKKVLSSAELDTLRKSRNPTTVITANGKVQTSEEAQVYVHDLELFVTVQIPEVTPAVLSLVKLRRTR